MLKYQLQKNTPKRTHSEFSTATVSSSHARSVGEHFITRPGKSQLQLSLILVEKKKKVPLKAKPKYFLSVLLCKST